MAAGGQVDWVDDERPRERVLAVGVAGLGVGELVALLLGQGTAGAPVARLAESLLDGVGGVRGLARSSVVELMAQPGIGLARACRIAAAFELARRAGAEPRSASAAIRSGADVAAQLAPITRDLQKEVFFALLLDGRHRLIHTERVSEGTLTSSIVHPREVFAPAIRSAAAAVIVAHNHPSGDPSPSREDLEVTARLADVGELVGIRVLDHVILGDPSYVSLRERGYLGPARRRAGGRDSV